MLISVRTLTAKYNELGEGDDDRVDDADDDEDSVAGGLRPEDLSSDRPNEDRESQDDIGEGGEARF